MSHTNSSGWGDFLRVVAELFFSLLLALIIIPFQASMMLIIIICLAELLISTRNTWRKGHFRKPWLQNLIAIGWFTNLTLILMALSVILGMGWFNYAAFKVAAIFLISSDIVSELYTFTKLIPGAVGSISNRISQINPPSFFNKEDEEEEDLNTP